MKSLLLISLTVILTLSGALTQAKDVSCLMGASTVQHILDDTSGKNLEVVFSDENETSTTLKVNGVEYNVYVSANKDPYVDLTSFNFSFMKDRKKLLLTNTLLKYDGKVKTDSGWDYGEPGDDKLSHIRGSSDQIFSFGVVVNDAYKILRNYGLNGNRQTNVLNITNAARKAYEDGQLRKDDLVYFMFFMNCARK